MAQVRARIQIGLELARIGRPDTHARERPAEANEVGWKEERCSLRVAARRPAELAGESVRRVRLFANVPSIVPLTQGCSPPALPSGAHLSAASALIYWFSSARSCASAKTSPKRVATPARRHLNPGYRRARFGGRCRAPVGWRWRAGCARRPPPRAPPERNRDERRRARFGWSAGAAPSWSSWPRGGRQREARTQAHAGGGNCCSVSSVCVRVC